MNLRAMAIFFIAIVANVCGASRAVAQCGYSVSIAAQDSVPGKAKGRLQASVDQPGKYTYKWSNGTAGALNSGLRSAIYTVSVTDEKGCKESHAGIVTMGAGSCSACLKAPNEKLALAVRYFTDLYNPTVGLMSVDKELTCKGECRGVVFQYMDGSGPAPIVPEGRRFLPFESRVTVAAFAGMGIEPAMVKGVNEAIQSLYQKVNWHPSWNRESMIGVIIPYKIHNKNWTFTPTGGSPFPVIDGFQYQVDQAAPWDVAKKQWEEDTTVPSMGMVDPNTPLKHFIDGTLFQAVNLYLRGDTAHAQINVQAVADICTVNSDGSVGFGNAPYRGMYLGTFLQTVEIVGTPKLKAGCSLDAIQKTLWALQQSDGSISRQYSCVSGPDCRIATGTDETTNAALSAYSPGLIVYIRQVAESHKFNLKSKADAHVTIEQRIEDSMSASR